jgi:hypothetical protein
MFKDPIVSPVVNHIIASLNPCVTHLCLPCHTIELIPPRAELGGFPRPTLGVTSCGLRAKYFGHEFRDNRFERGGTSRYERETNLKGRETVDDGIRRVGSRITVKTIEDDDANDTCDDGTVVLTPLAQFMLNLEGNVLS